MASPQAAASLSFLREHYGKKLKCNRNDVTIEVEKGKSLTGATTIAKHLLRTSQEFKDLSLEDRLTVEQWLEFSPTVCSLEASGDREKLRNLLQDFNRYMEDKVYVAANKLTVADVLLFHNLYPSFERMTFIEKEKLINVSRWFSHIQHEKKALQTLAPLTFLRTMLYDGPGHH